MSYKAYENGSAFEHEAAAGIIKTKTNLGEINTLTPCFQTLCAQTNPASGFRPIRF